MPLRGATVTCEARSPSGVVSRFNLYDDGLHADGPSGDGVYAYRVSAPAETGIWGVRVTASGPGATGPFGRMLKTTVRVGASALTQFPATTPEARIGPDQTLECDSPGGTPATLDASESVAQDNGSLLYLWADGNAGPEASVREVLVPLGTTKFAVSVSDGWTVSAPAWQELTVTDTVAPETVELRVEPNTLTADRRWLEVRPVLRFKDACDPSPDSELVSIVVQGGDEALACFVPADPEGSRCRDARVDEEGRVFLRAPPASQGLHWTYELTFRVSDRSGNAREVMVPVTAAGGTTTR